MSTKTASRWPPSRKRFNRNGTGSSTEPANRPHDAADTSMASTRPRLRVVKRGLDLEATLRGGESLELDARLQGTSGGRAAPPRPTGYKPSGAS